MPTLVSSWRVFSKVSIHQAALVAVACVLVGATAWYISPLRSDTGGEAGTSSGRGIAHESPAITRDGSILYLLPSSTPLNKLPATRGEMEGAGISIIGTLDELTTRVGSESVAAVMIDRDALSLMPPSAMTWVAARYKEGLTIVGMRISANELAKHIPVSKDLDTTQTFQFREGRIFYSLLYEKRSEHGDLCTGVSSDYLDRDNSEQALALLTRTIKATEVCDPRNPQ